MDGTYELLRAVRDASTERTLALLSTRSVDINAVLDSGSTLLSQAVGFGHSEIAKILLDNGASTSPAGCGGINALHTAAQGGHLSITKMLIQAGAEVDARTSHDTGGLSALHLAGMEGHSEVIEALIEAGGDPNDHDVDGITILHNAASGGHVDAVKVLLRAGASPLVPVAMLENYVPLDAAVVGHHAGVVRELLRQVGIEGCGGRSAGVTALELAVQGQQMDIMVMLVEAGVIDTGEALDTAARLGREAMVKFLLQQQHERNASGRRSSVIAADNYGHSLMRCCTGSACFASSRIVRLLLEAGAGTSCCVNSPTGTMVVPNAPLAVITRALNERVIEGQIATEKQLQSVEAIRRVLLQVEAVHAVSWLWPSDLPFIAPTVVEGTSGSKKSTSTLLTLMFPILRRRARRRGVLLVAISRYSGKS